MVTIYTVLILSAFVLCLFSSFKRPVVGYSFFLFLIICKPWIFSKIPMVFTSLHAPLVLGGALVIISLFSGANTPLSSSAKRSLIWFSVFLLACLTSRYGDAGGIFGHRYLSSIFKSYLLFYVGLKSIKSSDDFRFLTFSLLGMFLFISIVSYYNYKVLGFELPVPAYLFVDRNQFASTLAAVFPLFFLSLCRGVEGYVKYFFLFMLGMIPLCVIPSYSRGAFLCLFLSVVISGLFVKNKKKYYIAILFISLIGFMNVSDSYLDRLGTTTSYEEEASVAGRIATYIAAVDMFKDNPFFGVGVGNYNDLFWEYCPDKYRKFCRPEKSVHNLYLQVLSETGLAGFFSFMAVLWGAGRLILKDLFKTQNVSIKRINYCNIYGCSFIILCFGYLFIPGAYENFIFPLAAAVLSAVPACHSNPREQGT